MLADELQNQKHIAALIASELGLRGIEALHVRAATATARPPCGWPISPLQPGGEDCDGSRRRKR
jgi:hypothetical protein